MPSSDPRGGARVAERPTGAAAVPAVVADDLTGATDTAVQFARAGWHIDLTLDASAARPADVGTAVTTDIRNSSDEEGRAATREAVGRLIAAAPEAHVYLKVDSTMRGSVAGQISGALAAWRERRASGFAVVCPAYPELGRTVMDGTLLVDGVPVADSDLADDPVSPVRASRLVDLIPGAEALAGEGELVEDALARRAADPASAGRVFTVDAANRDELDRLGAAVAETASALPVGSAGLAGPLARAWHPAHSPEPVRLPARDDAAGALLQVSSLNPVSRGQLAHVVETWGDRAVVLAPDLATAADPAALVALCSSRADEIARAELVVLSAPEDRGGRDDAVRVADALGAATSRLIGSRRWRGVGLIGGDGSRAVLRHLGLASMRVAVPIAEGMPLSLVTDGPAAGTPIFTKAGGFGAVGALTTALEEILEGDDRRTS